MKKILIVDDSALMRRVLCDIINQDERFEVADQAANGLQALELLREKQYDAVVLDVHMPVMTGLQLLKELQKEQIPARVMMASTATKEGAETTLRALELGALDFIHKPNAVNLKIDVFSQELLMTLSAVADSRLPAISADMPRRTAELAKSAQKAKTTSKEKPANNHKTPKKEEPALPPIVDRPPVTASKDAIVAIACSTGGPLALQAVIPKLPAKLNAPVLIVQHMPKGFTVTLADRLNEMSELEVREAAEGEELRSGVVYIAKGGLHLNVRRLQNGRAVVHYTDEPVREGVKPCANYMYESLADSRFTKVVCVVMTGMGADGTVGIRNLKAAKPVYVITQSPETCTVYGMPGSAVTAALSDEIVPLEQIAQEIVRNVGEK